MDFHALQQKLFDMDPTDPIEDLAKLRAQASGNAPAPAETVDYITESASVPEGSLKMDRNYSVDDFAALAGVVTEKRQRNADQVRGSEPMPKAEPGREEHPFKDRLVGEEETSGFPKSFDKDTMNAINLLKTHYPNAKDELGAILKFISRIAEHSKEQDKEHTEKLEKIEERLDRIEKALNLEEKPFGTQKSTWEKPKKEESIDSIKESLYAALNKKMR